MSRCKCTELFIKLTIIADNLLLTNAPDAKSLRLSIAVIGFEERLLVKIQHKRRVGCVFN